ncbi:MAG: hypothetical protein IJI45_12475 [Anaerolineaceae bacterium]|nr:hypothetical protein [Anaerolineaceae bacterium]
MKANGEKLLNSIDGFLNAAAEETSCDSETALPFEAFDDYSTDPVSFNDQSKLMLDKVECVFNLAVKYNRKSSQYLKAVGQLEQGIKFLASGCMTKIALEGKNHELPDLGQLTTDKLFRMASYHYRKIDRALNESIQEKNGEIDDDLLSMEFRYYNLLNRLRSTEVRINKYNMNRWYDEKENYDPVINGLAFSEKSWNRDFNRKNLEPASFQRARAFSDQSAAFDHQSLGSAVPKRTCQDKPTCVNDHKEEKRSESSVQHTEKEAAEQISDSKSQCTNADNLPAAENKDAESTKDSESKIQGSDTNNESSRQILETEIQPATNQQKTETKTQPDIDQPEPKADRRSDADQKNPRPRLITEPPAYIEILQNALLRSGPDPTEDSEETLLTFTIDEITALAKDQDFARAYPDIAEQVQAQYKQTYPY